MKRNNNDEIKTEIKTPKLEHGPGGCHSFQKKKKRFCKMAVKPGEKYCGAHRDEGDDGAEDREWGTKTLVRFLK